MKLNQREIAELKKAIQIAEESARRMKGLLELAEDGTDINTSLLWDTKNHATQISAVLYNIHEDVYRGISSVVSE